MHLFSKRALDIIGALALIALLFPLLVLVAALVRFSSPGPTVFCQYRVGKGGRTFRMYKFRTMSDGNDMSIHRNYVRALISGVAEPNDGAFKLKRDTRVTPVGRFLRRWSIDELPQLFNVLKGDMSLVGPRPALVYEVELYGLRERERLSVAPGLTGLWQVTGRSLLSFEEMIDLDLAYIESTSIWLDLLILLRTPIVVLSGRGAC